MVLRAGTVPHQGLVRKIDAHGLDGKVKNWVMVWLCYREQGD